MDRANPFAEQWIIHPRGPRPGGPITGPALSAALLLVAVLPGPAWSQDQPFLLTAETNPTATPAQPEDRERFSPWEFTLDGQVGVPGGKLQVGETNAPGTSLRLHHDLGIDTSEAVQAAVAFHLTPQDALRLTFLYFFLNGSATVNHPIVYNGFTFPAGRVHTALDFYRLSLAYERVLLTLGQTGQLVGSAGITYVNLDAIVNKDHEDFYRQELPVPILGLRLEYPLAVRLRLTASLAGGLLPRVDSLRKEGGTVYLQQSHADAGLGLAYAMTPALRVEASYRFTYFTQHELSHEDNNAFRLIDSGVRLGLTYRF